MFITNMYAANDMLLFFSLPNDENIKTKQKHCYTHVGEWVEKKSHEYDTEGRFPHTSKFVCVGGH